jgi:hypothetical protein
LFPGFEHFLSAATHLKETVYNLISSSITTKFYELQRYNHSNLEIKFLEKRVRNSRLHNPIRYIVVDIFSDVWYVLVHQLPVPTASTGGLLSGTDELTGGYVRSVQTSLVYLTSLD